MAYSGWKDSAFYGYKPRYSMANNGGQFYDENGMPGTAQDVWASQQPDLAPPPVQSANPFDTGSIGMQSGDLSGLIDSSGGGGDIMGMLLSGIPTVIGAGITALGNYFAAKQQADAARDVAERQNPSRTSLQQQLHNQLVTRAQQGQLGQNTSNIFYQPGQNPRLEKVKNQVVQAQQMFLNRQSPFQQQAKTYTG